MGQKIFVTDFDGTLLNDNKTISGKDLDTLQELKRRNVIIAVATGRSACLFKKALLEIGAGEDYQDFPINYVIFSTGAGIMEFPADKLIYQKAIDYLDIQKITTYFDYRRLDYMVHKAIPDTHVFVYKFFGDHNPDFDARLALYKKFAQPFPESFENFGSATQVLGIIPVGKSPDQIDIIQQELSDFSVIHATSPLDHQSSWIEVFHKDVSKSKAVAWLLNRLGIMKQDVISVGNDYNDEDLLSWSGQAYVVNNAPDSLKRKFKSVLSNNHSGVTHAVVLSRLFVR
ncbi:MAG: HAD family hydrolase [Thermodesulfobacteriota bacterium]